MAEDLTTKVLVEIRDEIRTTRTVLEGELGELRTEFGGLRSEFHDFRGEATERFGILESALRDLAQQMNLLARATRVGMEKRQHSDGRIDDLEQRVEQLERRLPEG
jgi:archaellum component FlaC